MLRKREAYQYRRPHSDETCLRGPYEIVTRKRK